MVWPVALGTNCDLSQGSQGITASGRSSILPSCGIRLVTGLCHRTVLTRVRFHRNKGFDQIRREPQTTFASKLPLRYNTKEHDIVDYIGPFHAIELHYEMQIHLHPTNKLIQLSEDIEIGPCYGHELVTSQSRLSRHSFTTR